MCGCLFLMIPLPPSTTLTDTLVPYTTLFRSEVRGETPVSSEPSQRSLDDPAPGPHDEAFCRIRSLDDLDGPFADAAQGIPELFARIATIGNDMAQPREAADELGQQPRRAVAILAIGSVDHGMNQLAARAYCARVVSVPNIDPRKFFSNTRINS